MLTTSKAAKVSPKVCSSNRKTKNTVYKHISKNTTRNKFLTNGKKQMITGGIGFKSFKCNSNKKYVDKKAAYEAKRIFDTYNVQRKSYIQEDDELPVQVPLKNYRSNQELEFFNTAPTNINDELSNYNQSSVESEAREVYPYTSTNFKKTMLKRFNNKVISGKPLF